MKIIKQILYYSFLFFIITPQLSMSIKNDLIEQTKEYIKISRTLVLAINETITSDSLIKNALNTFEHQSKEICKQLDDVDFKSWIFWTKNDVENLLMAILFSSDIESQCGLYKNSMVLKKISTMFVEISSKVFKHCLKDVYEMAKKINTYTYCSFRISRPDFTKSLYSYSSETKSESIKTILAEDSIPKKVVYQKFYKSCNRIMIKKTGLGFGLIITGLIPFIYLFK